MILFVSARPLARPELTMPEAFSRMVSALTFLELFSLSVAPRLLVWSELCDAGFVKCPFMPPGGVSAFWRLPTYFLLIYKSRISAA